MTVGSILPCITKYSEPVFAANFADLVFGEAELEHFINDIGEIRKAFDAVGEATEVAAAGHIGAVLHAVGTALHADDLGGVSLVTAEVSALLGVGVKADAYVLDAYKVNPVPDAAEELVDSKGQSLYILPLQLLLSLQYPHSRTGLSAHLSAHYTFRSVNQTAAAAQSSTAPTAIGSAAAAA